MTAAQTVAAECGGHQPGLLARLIRANRHVTRKVLEILVRAEYRNAKGEAQRDSGHCCRASLLAVSESATAFGLPSCKHLMSRCAWAVFISAAAMLAA